jgi:hypothetical protein
MAPFHTLLNIEPPNSTDHCSSPVPASLTVWESSPQAPFTNGGDGGRVAASCRGPPAPPDGREDVVEEMAEAREMGIRQSPLLCRYCMAEPMSSSINLAACCSVSRRLLPPFSFPLPCMTEFNLMRLAIWMIHNVVNTGGHFVIQGN